MQIVFTVNGPGEISGWLFPLTRALREQMPGLRIVVCLLPCVYSTGVEVSVAERLGTVDAVLAVRDSLRLIARGRWPEGVRQDHPTLVFHLGGEIALTLLLAARLRAPVYGYAETPHPLMRRFRKVFFSGLSPLPGSWAADPGRIVGELMVDAARMRRSDARHRREGRRVLGLFPGSRAYMVGPALPYFGALVDTMAPLLPEIDFVMARSDYVSLDFLRTLPDPPEERAWPASRLRYHENGADPWFETEAGNRITILSGHQVLASADLALTFPGTSTGEIAASGVPMVVIFPTYTTAAIPLPGIAGYIDRIPFVGPRIKQFVGLRYLRSLPFLSLPNRRAGRMIVPELMGQDLHPQIIAAFKRLLAGDLQALGRELRTVMGEAGAAETLAAAIAGHFAGDDTPSRLKKSHPGAR